MATPKKVTSITLETTTLSGSGLKVTSFDKTALLNWLNSMTEPKVAVYYEDSDLDSPEPFRLVMAPESSSGTISAANHLQSAPLPCPPHCKPR